MTVARSAGLAAISGRGTALFRCAIFDIGQGMITLIHGGSVRW